MRPILALVARHDAGTDLPGADGQRPRRTRTSHLTALEPLHPARALIFKHDVADFDVRLHG